MEGQDAQFQTTFTPDALFFARPYLDGIRGFFFSNTEEYFARAKACVDSFGRQVEEFEIAYVGRDELDNAVFETLDIHQGSIVKFMDRIDDLDDHQKIKLVLAVRECGCDFDLQHDDPDDLDVDIYADMRLIDLAYQFIDEGLFGEIPEPIANYIDYEAIARDLRHDYSETQIAGENYVYRMR